MSTVTIPYPKVAEAALAMLEAASVPADDASLALAIGVRSLLRDIATGALMVLPAAPSQPAPVSQPAATIVPPAAVIAAAAAPAAVPPASPRVRAGAPTKAILGPGPARGSEGVIPAGAPRVPPMRAPR